MPSKHHAIARPALSAVVVTFRRRDLLQTCLQSLRAALGVLDEPTELVVVDNGSRDGTSDFVRAEFPEVNVVEIASNVGFTPGMMTGVRRSSGEWIALLNDDATVEPDALARLLAVGRSSPDIGSVAPQLRFAQRPGVINSAGIEVDRLGVPFDRLVGAPVEASEAQDVEVFGVSGCVALYRRRMLEEIGWFDESFFAYLEDADVAWRARMRGWRAIYCPRAVAYHHHSATLVHRSPLKYFLVGRNRVRLLAKNADRRHLWHYALPILVYDIAYVLFAAVKDRTLAPARGRLRGLREWGTYSRAGRDGRRPISLAPGTGLRGALRRRRTWSPGKPAI